VEPNHERAYNACAFIYFFDIGDYAKGIADWEVVLHLNPNDSSARMNIERAKEKWLIGSGHAIVVCHQSPCCISDAMDSLH
jgi:hypothetical protein